MAAMGISLYVEKADGVREELEQVSADTACEVYAKMDWGAEVRALCEAQEAGREAWFPEFGLADDAGFGSDALRSLIIAPIDPGTVSFRFEVQDRNWQSEKFPAGETSALIRLFFDGNDGAIAALAKPPAVAHELSGEEFRATVLPPPLAMEIPREAYHRISLREYITACIGKHQLPVSPQDIEFEDLVGFTDGRDPSLEQQFVHLLFHFGDPDSRLVIVVQEAKDGTPGRIVGHRLVETGEAVYEECEANGQFPESFANFFLTAGENHGTPDQHP